MDHIPAETELRLPHVNTTIKVRHFLNQEDFLEFIKPLRDAEVQSMRQYMNYSSMAYPLEGGAIAVNFKGECNIFYNAGDLDMYFGEKMYTDSNMPRHFFFNKNPYGQKYPTEASRLSDDFKKELGFESDSTSEEILKKVTSKIDMMPDRRKFIDGHLLEIVALVGEAYRRDHRNEDIYWTTQLAKDRLTWVPNLESSKGFSNITETLSDFLFGRKELDGEDPLEMTYVMISTRI